MLFWTVDSGPNRIITFKKIEDNRIGRERTNRALFRRENIEEKFAAPENNEEGEFEKRTNE